MAKATIKTREGTHITIEGEQGEIVKIIKLLEEPAVQTKTVKSQHKKREGKASTKLSMQDLVEELKEEKFFDEPRSIVEIKNAFSTKGHIYSINAISTPLLRLVRKRILGRTKEDGKWLYVKR